MKNVDSVFIVQVTSSVLPMDPNDCLALIYTSELRKKGSIKLQLKGMFVWHIQVKWSAMDNLQLISIL